MYNQSELKKIIDRSIINLSFNTEAERLIDPVKYILSIGGKRLRPVLALMACNLFNDKIDDAVIPVTGLEVFHNFTLVHDDIMDQALVRRNFPTVHSKWNINQAILSGDVMAFISNDCFLQTPPHLLLKVFRTFNKAAIDVCIGQQLDIDYEKATIVSQEEYLKMIELKTAALLAASVKIGAFFGGAEDKDSDLLYEFGKNLGLAFQIQDDLLDVYGDVKVFGKVSGGDVVAGKKTYLFVKAMEIAPSGLRKQLQEEFSKENSGPEAKIKAITAIYNQLNIKSITEKLANEYINSAFNYIEKVSVQPERKEEMIQVTRSLIGRDH